MLASARVQNLVTGLAVAVALATTARAQPAAPAPAAAPKPEIFFRAPANGATVPATFPVVFGLRNYGVAPAGVNATGVGHFHVLVNTAAPATGVVIPQDTVNLHFGKGQIETTITLKPGRHTLRLVLGDHEHKVIGPELISAPITVTVRP
ncbi:MAG: DUF4399 domain-containing protein [Gemmatimonadetes bacterium]|nr:DUF4399 domain-containing protein [Gemmatimonadota bacterium]